MSDKILFQRLKEIDFYNNLGSEKKTITNGVMENTSLFAVAVLPRNYNNNHKE